MNTISSGAGRECTVNPIDFAISGTQLGALPWVKKLVEELLNPLLSAIELLAIQVGAGAKSSRSVNMIWTLKVWCMATMFATVAMWLPSLQTWLPAEAVRSPHITMPVSIVYPGSSGAEPLAGGDGGAGELTPLPAFREAPAYRNGGQCASFETRNQSESVCGDDDVHVAITLDAFYLRGSMAVIFSILKHSECPENVMFHFLVSDRDAELQSLVHSTFPFLRFKLYHFDEMMVKVRISPSVRSALEQPLNYARNYLADLLEPCVKRVIYLDSDLVVVDDISKLWGISLGDHALGAPVYCHANFTKYFTSAFWSDASLASTFDGRNPCYFNTGVMVMDLVKWRQEKYTQIIESWMDIQKDQKRIYELGSLPPFLLVFAGDVQAIEHRWNQHGLGGDNLHGRCRPLHPGPVSLLHWSGKGKPWLRLDSRTSCPLDSLWAPYDLTM